MFGRIRRGLELVSQQWYAMLDPDPVFCDTFLSLVSEELVDHIASESRTGTEESCIAKPVAKVLHEFAMLELMIRHKSCMMC